MQTAVTTPTELLKIRLQLQTQLPGHPGYVGPLRLLKQVTMREGVSGALLPIFIPQAEAGGGGGICRGSNVGLCSDRSGASVQKVYYEVGGGGGVQGK